MVSPLSIVLSVAALAIIISAFAVGMNYQSRYNRFVTAVSAVVDNDIFCAPQVGRCRLQVVDNLTPPMSISDQFDYGTALYASDLISRVALLFYNRHGVDRLVMPTDMRLVDVLEYDNKTIGYVAYHEVSKLGWIVYRGTSDDKEWRQDFAFSQVNTFRGSHTSVDSTQVRINFGIMREGYSNALNSTVNPSVDINSNIMCHKGFVDIFSEFSDSIRHAIASLPPDTEFLLCGHSLGAALATLTSMAMPDIKHSVYTFGGPRVCQNTFSYARGFWRVCNTCDVVTTLPLPVMPNATKTQVPHTYMHFGTEVSFTDNRHSLTNNHLLPVYINALTKKSCRISQEISF